MSAFIVQQYNEFTIVLFTVSDLRDSAELPGISAEIYRLVDQMDRRHIILDFETVQYLSSTAVSMLLELRKKLAALPHSSLVLCGIGPRLAELLHITALDKVLTIKPTQAEAVRLSRPPR